MQYMVRMKESLPKLDLFTRSEEKIVKAATTTMLSVSFFHLSQKPSLCLGDPLEVVVHKVWHDVWIRAPSVVHQLNRRIRVGEGEASLDPHPELAIGAGEAGPKRIVAPVHNLEESPIKRVTKHYKTLFEFEICLPGRPSRPRSIAPDSPTRSHSFF